MMELTNNKLVGLSAIAALLIGTNVYAGKIIGATPTDEVNTVERQQFGFGGWNLSNVDVKITDLDYNEIAKVFDETDGTYDEMTDGDSFESQITTGGEHRGNLHGKDWPVGEPAGIKVINEDTKVKHGKPVNCIMTSSYLSADHNPAGTNGYLDAFYDNDDTTTPAPTLCSSAWQTHKRFKVNLLEETVNTVDSEGYGEPVDLIFNLDASDTSTDVVRYQVLQKINNYTGMRLDGYKVEVLDGNGDKNPNLTLSLGIGEGDTDDDGIIDGDIWEESEMANFSHGLWGPYQRDRFDNGFFDYIRAYFPVTLSEDAQTISYHGPMQGGNYQEIFGNWLHEEWAPKGIFYDHDNDPSTDALLEAFFGVAPGQTELGWWKRTVEDPYGSHPIYTWMEPTVADFVKWEADAYSIGEIEDVLNLGLNYIVNVGDNSAIPTGTFIVRITPHVDEDQTAPSYVGVDPEITNTSSKGEIEITPNPIFNPGQQLTVLVSDLDLNLDDTKKDEVNVTMISDAGDQETLTLKETDLNSSMFTGVMDTVEDGNSTQNNDRIGTSEGTVVTAIYSDADDGTGVSTEVNASTTAHTLVPPTADAGADVTVAANETVTITGTGTVDEYSEYVYYEWKDQATKMVLATTASFDYSWTEAGTYSLTFKVTDVFGKSATDDMNVTVTPADDDGNTASSGGGGCTYNPNSKQYDMMFFVMMALGLFYIGRKKFARQ